MSATREHRNAGAIEECIQKAVAALDEAGALLEELAAFLPDEYPYMPVVEAHGEAVKAVNTLMERQGE